MKNIFKHSFLVVALLSFIQTTIQAQTVIRPYNEWEATQFVAVLIIYKLILSLSPYNGKRHLFDKQNQ